MERFLLYDSGPSESRILIFSHYRSLEILTESSSWYADDTLKMASLLFYSNVCNITSKLYKWCTSFAVCIIIRQKQNKHMNSYYK